MSGREGRRFEPCTGPVTFAEWMAVLSWAGAGVTGLLLFGINRLAKSMRLMSNEILSGKPIDILRRLGSQAVSDALREDPDFNLDVMEASIEVLKKQFGQAGRNRP